MCQCTLPVPPLPGLTLGGTLFVRLMSCAKPFLPISERQSLRYNTTDTTIQRYLGLWLRSSVCCPRNMIDSSRLEQATSSEIFCLFLLTYVPQVVLLLVQGLVCHAFAQVGFNEEGAEQVVKVSLLFQKGNFQRLVRI